MPTSRNFSRPYSVLCYSCGEFLHTIRGKDSAYTLPIGISPGALKKSGLYDNTIIGGPISSPPDRYSCMCRDTPEDHIHCLKCWTNIIEKCNMTSGNIPESRPAKAISKPLDWMSVCDKVLGYVNYPLDLVKGAEPLIPAPCICTSFVKDIIHSNDVMAVVEQLVSTYRPDSPRCPHKESLSTDVLHDDFLPRSVARSYVHDPTAGALAPVYEQYIGSGVICKFKNIPIKVQEHPNWVHLLIRSNYDTKTKGYAESFPQCEAVTALGKLHVGWGGNARCHGICQGDRDPIKYSHCRLLDSETLIWMIDIGIMDGSSCGKCNIDVLSLIFAMAIDTPDRIKDSITSEIFNINKYGRQSELAIFTWRALHTDKTDGFCCERSRRVCRATRNMMFWVFCNPAYFTTKWARDEGLLGFVEAINWFVMSRIAESELEASATGDGPAKVDDIVRRVVDTGLTDFILYICA
ncbi:hypothetical protein EYR41_002116 [Orbilia oligospora]|uniref:Uncharacterized protein n=1 Tax=Orbilia oligospora TaxID=2813651 RepID=A0A7C8KXB5_ORBOL|nr:hypothetical protein TWF751_004698 [Orbilia oligospora]TGJ75175.1 hypothetical protein EYR41_002116 [Orbilia oligospora]